VFAVFVVIDDTVAARLNVTLIDVFRATPVAPSVGEVAETLKGGSTSRYFVSLGMPLVKIVAKAGPGGKLLTAVDVNPVSDQPAVDFTGRKAT
jgi:hypothetical protein